MEFGWIFWVCLIDMVFGLLSVVVVTVLFLHYGLVFGCCMLVLVY